jgi:hypothetical protein
MDRGVPTEEVLAEMRTAAPSVQYVVGTPKGRLTRLGQDLLAKPWQQVRPGLEVKLLPQDGEHYVFAQSRDRVAKERAMRRRQLKWLWKRLGANRHPTREKLLMKLGAARSQAPTAWRLVAVAVPNSGTTFSYRLDRNKLRQARRREGSYLLRTNLTEDNPAQLWSYCLQLVAVEEAFKNLKGDLAIRPIFHQDEARVEAHIFIAFVAGAGEGIGHDADQGAVAQPLLPLQPDPDRSVFGRRGLDHFDVAAERAFAIASSRTRTVMTSIWACNLRCRFKRTIRLITTQR